MFTYYNEPDKNYKEILKKFDFLCNWIIDNTNNKNDESNQDNDYYDLNNYDNDYDCYGNNPVITSIIYYNICKLFCFNVAYNRLHQIRLITIKKW